MYTVESENTPAPPPRGDSQPTFSESLMSPVFKTAQLRKKWGQRGVNGPLIVEKKMPKKCFFFI